MDFSVLIDSSLLLLLYFERSGLSDDVTLLWINSPDAPN